MCRASHILSGPNGCELVYKISGSDWILHYIMCFNNGVRSDRSNELRMVDSDDGSVSPVSPQHNYLEVLTAQLEYYDHSVFG